MRAAPTRREVLAGLVVLAVARCPRAHGQKVERCVAMEADTPGVGVFFILIVQGAGGEFIYDAAGNLRSADVGQVTTDPLQGITCQQGRSTFNGHGAVITLQATALDATFLYADTGTSAQGALIASDASAGGVDPFGTTFQAGRVAYSGPTNWVQLLSSVINLHSTTEFAPSVIQEIAPGTLGLTAGLLTIADSALQVRVLSKLGTGVAGSSGCVVIGELAPVTTAALEVAGAVTLGQSNALLATYSTDASGYPTVTDLKGLAQNVSGCEPAATGVNTVTQATFNNLAVFTIPAGDAEAGATYELECGGNGNTGTTPQNLTFQARFGATPGAPTDVVGQAAPLGTSAWTASHTFQWSAKIKAVCVSSGAAAKWRIFLTGTITDTAAAVISTTTQQLSFAVGTGAAPGGDVTQDSTASISMGLSAEWAAVTGGPTISKTSAEFGRRA